MDHICTWLARCQQQILSVKYKGFLALIPTPNSDREAYMPIYINPFSLINEEVAKLVHNVSKITNLYELFKITVIFGNFLNTNFAEGELF